MLSHGYAMGRGKAFAQGTAYAGGNGFYRPTGSGSGGSSSSSSIGSNSSNNNSGGGNSSSAQDATNDFKEVFDWFEVKLEEINELLEYWGAQLENIVGMTGKASKIDNIIKENKYKLDILAQGFKLYEDYTEQLLVDIPAQYREAAKDGKIAIETFAGDASEKTLEAIKNYREWAEKTADVKQQMEELVTTIAELAKQRFDVIDDEFDNKISLITAQIERLKDAVDLTKNKGYVASKQYYQEMTNLASTHLEELQAEHKALQDSLDMSVKAGDIQKYSDKWYEMVKAIYDVDNEIMACTSDLEDFQNAINDIYWDNFSNLINQFEYFENEVNSLVDLMQESNDLVTDLSKTKDYWFAPDVTWTQEGVVSLGLYVQNMEEARLKSDQYAKAISDLVFDYKNGKYSVNEYNEKLNELKQNQYSAIKQYYTARKAIVDLNKTRIDAIKEGIDKEIEAYEKLIKKRKEALDIEKDAYNFQKTVNEKQKNIDSLERQISALSADTSLSATAQRKKLESELAEAQKDLDDEYYDRSIETQQEALDKELSNLKEQKDKEKKEWENYLKDTEKIINDAVDTITNNEENGSNTIYSILIDKAQEYNLTLSEAVIAPWQDGASAINEYQNTFDTSSSKTYDELNKIKTQWQDIIALMDDAAYTDIQTLSKDNQIHIKAEKNNENVQAPIDSSTNNTTVNTSVPSLSNGNIVVIKRSATHFATGQQMASFVPGGSYSVYETDGDKVLIGRNGAYTGWVYKHDIEGYATGTTKTTKPQLARIDELGEELVLHAGPNGRLQFLTKGTSVIPADITQNLMQIGSINPQEILDRNRPSVTPVSDAYKNEMSINITYGDIMHIDNFDGTDLEAINKLVTQKFNEHTKQLNNSLKKYVR